MAEVDTYAFDVLERRLGSPPINALASRLRVQRSEIIQWRDTGIGYHDAIRMCRLVDITPEAVWDGFRKPPVKIMWEEPPDSRAKIAELVPGEILEELKLNPDRWARVVDFNKTSTASSTATRINGTERILGVGWEAKGRRMPSGSGSYLYLRWTGRDNPPTGLGRPPKPKAPDVGAA